ANVGENTLNGNIGHPDSWSILWGKFEQSFDIILAIGRHRRTGSMQEGKRLATGWRNYRLRKHARILVVHYRQMRMIGEINQALEAFPTGAICGDGHCHPRTERTIGSVSLDILPEKTHPDNASVLATLATIPSVALVNSGGKECSALAHKFAILVTSSD